MKAHVFISVLAFHIVVIAGLYLLSACSSSSGPSAGQTSPGSTGGSIYDSYAQPNRPVEDDSLVVTQVNPPPQSTRLDPAFNTGSDAYNVPSPSRGERFTPRRPDDGGYGNQGTPEINPLLNEEVLTPLGGPEPTTAAVEYVVERGDSLWKISREYGISLNELLQANGLDQNSPLQVGQRLVIPAAGAGSPAPVASPVVASTASASGSESYTVVKGDTLSRIAQLFNTTVNDIKAANGLSSDVIQLNQQLTIPVNSRSTGASVSAPPPTTTTAPAPVTPQPAPSDFDGIIHVVEAGETPSAIARLYGITTAQLMRDNAIADARRIRVGQKLKIFLGAAQPASTPTATGAQPTSQPVSTPTLFDDSVFNSLDDIPEVNVVPQN